MSILTIGGDLRYAHMTRFAAAQSAEIAAIGLENAPFSLPSASIDDIRQADAVIMPNPFRGGLSLPFAAQPFTLHDITIRLRKESLIILSDSACIPPDFAPCRIISLGNDEEYVRKNARLTAEAALIAAASASIRSLEGAMCLVIGYGRIGRRLCALLHSLGADTAAVARRQPVREEIEQDGIRAFSMEELPLLLPRAHFIFSTPPQTVLQEAHLRLIGPDTLLMDLSSPPYGFDLELARSLSVSAVRENGLPGRYYPLSAGEALWEAVRRTLDHHLKGESSCR